MKILNELWEKEDLNMRHVIEGLSEDKQKRHINNFNNYYIKYIDTKKIKKSLDWGCGGGLLTKELQKFSKEVHCVDVSKKSIKSCISYSNPTKTYLLDVSPLDLDLPQVDLVLANAIVWHFPSLQYFKDAISKWVELNPKYIVFNTKAISETLETKDYANNILNALKLNDNDVIDLFKLNNYKLTSQISALNTAQPSTYFVFEKL
jgi:2-polyprenyl-3-methyl-5-hydroxy-6-metoxy-1,4-benzoquinol methylase|tara:strand:+ start:2378 stop:2992 length:615 start_codon:yes stop_codon:yes gene_type:complete